MDTFEWEHQASRFRLSTKGVKVGVINHIHLRGKPSQSFVVIVDEQVRFGINQFLKHIEKEIAYVDHHHLPVVDKLHLQEETKGFFY